MGKRVDNANNKVVQVADAEVIYCPNCGDEASEQGHADLPWAEARWLDVGGTLCCSVYCAAKHSGYSEKEAQLARAQKTRANARRDGVAEEVIAADEQYVTAILYGNAGSHLTADIEKLTTESGEPHGGPYDEDVSQGDDDLVSEGENILKNL